MRDQQQNPQALGAQQNLGNLQALWQPKSIATVFIIVLYSVVSVSVTAGFVIVLAVSLKTLLLPASVPLMMKALAFLVPTTIWVVLTGFSLIAVISTYRGRVRRTYVYEAGLIHIDNQRSRQVIPWQEVREVWHGWHDDENAVEFCNIVCSDRTMLALAGSMTSRLATMVEREITGYLLPAALRDYQANQRVDFGPVAVSSQGFFHQTTFLPWEEVGHIEVSGPTVRVSTRGERRLWAVADVPNSKLLMEVVYHHHRLALQALTKRDEQLIKRIIPSEHVPIHLQHE